MIANILAVIFLLKLSSKTHLNAPELKSHVVQTDLSHAQIENVRTSCNIFGEGLIRGKITKFALQIVKKALKSLLQHVNFQKFSEGACPRTPYNNFSFPICFKFNFNIRLKNVKIWC